MDWPTRETEAREIQRALAAQVVCEDRLGRVRRIAGADVAYETDGDRYWAAVTVLSADTLEIVEVATHEGKDAFPYIPGCLSFRELPALLPCFSKLSEPPDLIVCDGNGLLHPRRFGVAAHLGVLLDLPAIGCAKNLLLGAKPSLEQARGSRTPIVVDGAHLGDALRTQNGVKPVYVSVGHRVCPQTACDWVLKLAATYRLPETTRAADHEVNRLRREALSSR
ncbi:MAG: deoxyribonuclease V [Myxococcota bacterium]